MSSGLTSCWGLKARIIHNYGQYGCKHDVWCGAFFESEPLFYVPCELLNGTHAINGMVCRVYTCWGLHVNVCFCVMYMMLTMASRCMARWPSSSTRQSSGVMFCGLKIIL